MSGAADAVGADITSAEMVATTTPVTAYPVGQLVLCVPAMCRWVPSISVSEGGTRQDRTLPPLKDVGQLFLVCRTSRAPRRRFTIPKSPACNSDQLRPNHQLVTRRVEVGRVAQVTGS